MDYAASVQGASYIPPGDQGGIYEDRPFTYVYNPPNGQLTALQFLNPDSVAIETDADFWCTGWYIVQYTGPFTVQLVDSWGYPLQSAALFSAALSLSQSNPTVLSPAHPFPAGGKIQLYITDVSGSTNPLQIGFVGFKRFKILRAS
jgi:hypothetical protein